MRNPTRRRPRYQPGDRIVHHPTNRPGMVIAVLPHRQRLVATTESGRTRMATAAVVPARELRPEIDLAA